MHRACGFAEPPCLLPVPGSQFEIFWEAEAPERPDPYLSNLDLAAMGTRLENRMDAAGKRQAHLRVVK